MKTMLPVNWIQLIAISLVVAFCGVFGASYALGEGWAALPLVAEVGLTVAGTVACCVIGLLFGMLFERLTVRPYGPYLPERRLPLWALAVIMLAAWSPWIIANYPGSMLYDTFYQIYQFQPHGSLIPLIQYTPVAEDTLVNAWMVDHHPWLVSIIYGSIAQASDGLTGTWMAGFFLTSCVQAMLYIALFVWLIREFRAWGVPRGVRIAFFVVVCLVPVFPVWASCIVKDSLFGLCFLAWFILLVKAALSKGESLSKAKPLVAFFLLALMMCLTKKTGVYIVIGTAVIACIIFRKQRGAISALSAFALQGIGCALVMFAIIPALVFPALNIVPSGAQEALGTVFQQTARYAQDHELTEEEERIIDEVVAIEAVKENYDPANQDYVKYYYNTRVYPENMERYLQLYVEQGVKDPEAYFGAVMAIAGAYVAPVSHLNLRMVTVDTDWYDRHVLWNPPELDWLRGGLDAAYKSYASTPVLNLPVLTVVYALWMPALLLFVCLKRREHIGVLFVPMAIILGFCIIGPMVDARYAWGLVLATPILFCASTVAPLKGMPSVFREKS